MRLPGAEGGRRPRSPAEIEKEIVALVRDKIGPVAAFKLAITVGRLPKTRSGKILRGTMKKIADGDAWTHARDHRGSEGAGRDRRGAEGTGRGACSRPGTNAPVLTVSSAMKSETELAAFLASLA